MKSPHTSDASDASDADFMTLMSVVMKSFEKTGFGLSEGLHWTLTGPLQFAYRANRSVDDAVNIGLHFIL